MPRKFLVVADDTPEFDSALRYAARRARSTGGRVALLRVLSPASFENWSGVREEIERQQRSEAEALLSRIGERAADLAGAPAVFLIEVGDTRDGIRRAIEGDPEIKILVLAAAQGGRPGPLVTAVAKDGLGGARRLPVTIVPGDLSDQEIERKFRFLAEKALGRQRADAVLKMAWSAEKLKDVRDLLKLLDDVTSLALHDSREQILFAIEEVVERTGGELALGGDFSDG